VGLAQPSGLRELVTLGELTPSAVGIATGAGRRHSEQEA
jgi:hypothetical protein